MGRKGQMGQANIIYIERWNRWWKFLWLQLLLISNGSSEKLLEISTWAGWARRAKLILYIKSAGSNAGNFLSQNVFVRSILATLNEVILIELLRPKRMIKGFRRGRGFNECWILHSRASVSRVGWGRGARVQGWELRLGFTFKKRPKRSKKGDQNVQKRRPKSAFCDQSVSKKWPKRAFCDQIV